ncbi:MAG: C1 family peptidase [Muribaculaceae bacterium]|nr:C1 family peptidase [Muribaculaceae bacterium]
MKKLFIATVMLCASTIGLSAQNSKGGISEDMLKEISKGYTGSAEQKAVRNALAVNPISELSVNAENLSMCDTYFSHQVKTKGITNQLSSGRCWLFTGLNVLRAKMIDKYELPEMVFSHNYISFHDLLEKSNLFLQAIIDTRKEAIDSRQVEWLLKSPIGDGGQFTGVSNLIMKYGVVPKSVMPETYQSNNTDEMRNILKLKLREYALVLRAADSEKSAMALKTQMLTEIYRILAECVGVPPTEFEWTRYDKDGKPVSTKTYTPKSFYQEYIGADLENNYVMVMNDPSREYYKVYEIDLDRHVYDGENWVYVNLPIEKIKEMAIASIKDNTAMYFSCDVRKFWNKDKGTLDLNNIDYASLFRTSFPMTKKERIQTFASGSTHAMTLIAVDLDEQGTPKKWMVENSWGEKSGYKGNLIMTDEWFNEYMFRLVVEKKYVPADVMELLKQKPIMLPAWDPMFADEE